MAVVLRALDMRATIDREEFFGFQHGNGRLKLIERLAAAYRAGELPDYMLEFVDSLRTRAEQTTSGFGLRPPGIVLLTIPAVEHGA